MRTDLPPRDVGEEELDLKTPCLSRVAAALLSAVMFGDVGVVTDTLTIK